MATNQLHGLAVEDLICASGVFPGADDEDLKPCAEFDITDVCDPVKKLPTSVKATKNTIVGLADARRVWKSFSETPFRMVVARYAQFSNKKVFGELLEFEFDPSLAREILGGITLDDVRRIHDGIGLDVFPEGQHEKARRWAGKEVKSLNLNRGLVGLNVKIDSQRQRRVQCSFSLKEMISLFERHNRPVMIYDESFGTLNIPFSISSTKREFRSG